MNDYPGFRPAPAAVGNMHGREDAIKSNHCIAPPVGCGRELTREQISMWPMETQSEYTISGMCWTCQNAYFGAETVCTCDSPCCEADVGVGIITCGSLHCPEHGPRDIQ